MPTSLPNQINEILTLILGVAPQSVLDIGVGFGKYGFLAREYLEMEHGQGTYGKWTKRIEGIEAFEEYITPLHREIYDEIHIG
ncbi:MAG: glycosyltransferase family 1 protein, partial [Planctomycetota bacterium]